MAPVTNVLADIGKELVPISDVFDKLGAKVSRENNSPGLLLKEAEKAGFLEIYLNAVESCVWLMPDMDKNWEIPELQNNVLRIIRKIEKDMGVMGISLHFMAIGKK